MIDKPFIEVYLPDFSVGHFERSMGMLRMMNLLGLRHRRDYEKVNSGIKFYGHIPVLRVDTGNPFGLEPGSVGGHFHIRNFLEENLSKLWRIHGCN